MVKWLRRSHRYPRTMVDAMGWPHQRPTRDPRLVCLHIALPWVAFVQCLRGPGPTTVQAQAFSMVATLVFSAMLVTASALVLYAAYCRSQYWSFVTELAGCVMFTGVFGIYSYALINVIADWYSSTGAAWALAFFAGNLIRAVVLGRRLW